MKFTKKMWLYKSLRVRVRAWLLRVVPELKCKLTMVQ